jgi:hypothetical protein
MATATESIFRGSINPQLESKLWQMPVEIRHAIYSNIATNEVHVFIRKGQLCLSKCIMEEHIDGIGGYSFKDPIFKPFDPISARRLSSSWGTHWKCEEIAMRMNETHPDANDARLLILRTCKRL